MIFYCSNCIDTVEAKTFEETASGEAQGCNGIDEHTHCSECQRILTASDIYNRLNITLKLRDIEKELSNNYPINELSDKVPQPLDSHYNQLYKQKRKLELTLMEVED